MVPKEDQLRNLLITIELVPASEATIALTVRPKVEDEGCATTGRHAPTRLPATLLLLLGAAARWRRQRRA